MNRTAAVLNSLRGLRRALMSERAMRREVLIFLLACPAVYVIGHDIGDRAVLLGSIEPETVALAGAWSAGCWWSPVLVLGCSMAGENEGAES